MREVIGEGSEEEDDGEIGAGNCVWTTCDEDDCNRE